jgi:hypothetical protein
MKYVIMAMASIIISVIIISMASMASIISIIMYNQ